MQAGLRQCVSSFSSARVGMDLDARQIEPASLMFLE